MSGTYLALMRGASVILLGAAIFIFAGTLLAALLAYRAIYAEPLYQPALEAGQFSQLLSMLTGGVQGAVLPFLGAAGLWRADVWLRRGTPVNAAEAAE